MRCLTLFLLLLPAACDPGEVVLLAPDKSPSDAPALTVHAVIDTPYTDVAAALGWTAGVPQAQVRVHLMKEPYDSSYWHEAVGDSTGVATFTDLLAGLYEVEIVRQLTTAETASGGGVRVVAGGRRLAIPLSQTADVTVAPDGRGALVFEEVMLLAPAYYGDARYFEIYNNTDTTIYLDGKLLGVAWDFISDFPYWPCAQTEPVRNDPLGIWTTRVMRFPGQGREYPLEAGQLALVARTAIDHRLGYPELYDLTEADFEMGGVSLGGGSSADNPDVPNLEDIGLVPMAEHPINSDPVYLAEPQDLGSLPRYVDPHSGRVYVRIPAAAVLDATRPGILDFTKHGTYEAAPACREDMNKAFERLPGPADDYVTDWPNRVSYQRRVLYVLPDGRKVLQDTDTSMEDFVKAVWSPGWIPEWLGG
jgi:hypothetical protein